MNDSRDRFAILKEMRPATTVDDAWYGQDRDACLQQILTHPAGALEPARQSIERRPTPLRRRLVLAGALTAVIGVAAAVPVFTANATYAATPTMLQFVPVAGQQTARSVLADLAHRAEAQPQPKGQGRYHYIHSKGWYLHVSADLDNRVLDSGIAEIDRQLWLASDGSGRLVRQNSADRTPLNPDMTLAAGEMDGRFLPGEAATAVVQAKYRRAVDATGWTQTIEEVWSQQVVPPALHARLLTTLAAQPGVTLLGDTTDRIGRAGVAISAEDDRGTRERRILVFQPETGALLDAETVVLEDSELPVQPPATIAYTVYLTAGYTNTTASRP